MSDVSGLVATTVLNTIISEVGNKIPSVSGLVTTVLLDTKIKEIENKIPVVSGLIRKTDYSAKVSGIKTKYYTTTNYNKFTSEILDAKIVEGKY